MVKKIFQNRVFQNISFLTVGSVLSQLVGLIALIKIAQILNPSDYGQFTFLLTQGQLLMTISDLGIQNIVIRTIARDSARTKELLRTGILLKTIAVFVITGFYVVYNLIYGNLNNQQLILVGLFALFNCSGNLFESIFWGHQKMLMPALINLIWSILWLLFVVLIRSDSVKINFLFIVFSGLTLIKSGVLFLNLFLRGYIKGNINTSFMKGSLILLSESWPYFSLVILMLPVNFFSNNFLDINSTSTEIGYFNLSNKMMRPVTMVIGFSLAAIFPNLSALYLTNKNKFNTSLSFGFKYIMMISLLMCFLFTLFAEEIFSLLFSAEYLPAVKVTQLQIWYVFLMGINSVIGTIWGATNKERLIFKTAVVNALISTPFLYLGSKYGALGISYAYVFSFIVFEIYLWNVFKASVDFKIKGEKLLWIGFVLLFVASYYFLNDCSLTVRIFLALLIVVLFASFFYAEYSRIKSLL